MSIWFIATYSQSYPSFLTKFGMNSCEKSLQYLPFIILLSLYPFNPAEIIPRDSSADEQAVPWDEVAMATARGHVLAGPGKGEDTRQHLVHTHNLLCLNYTVHRRLIAQ